MTLLPIRWFAVLSVLTVAAGARADDARYEIRDAAGLFSAEAVQKALEALRQIPDETRKTRAEEKLSDGQPPDVVIETAASPPDDVKKQLQEAKDNAQRAHCLNDWGARQAEAEGVHGVYVLLCKDVVRGWFGKEYGYPVVVVRPEAEAADFTSHDAWWLQFRLKSMTSRPDRVKDRDAKLLGAVTQVREVIRYHLQPSFPWLDVGGVLGGVLGLWAVLGLVRMRLEAVTPVSGPTEQLRPALYNGLLGGMFGTAAAHWIYDTLFIAASRSVAPDEPAAPPPEPQPAESVEPPPPTREERLDLAAHDDPADEASVPAPTQS